MNCSAILVQCVTEFSAGSAVAGRRSEREHGKHDDRRDERCGPSHQPAPYLLGQGTTSTPLVRLRG